MGTSHSRELSSLSNHLSPGQRWNVLSKEANKNVVRNSDGVTADEYTITIEPFQSVRSQLQTYSYRKTQDLPLVRVLAAEISEVPSSPGFCSGGMHSHGRVLTQHIKYVLSDAPQMSFPQAMYTLSESLIGFRHLHQKVGPFQITDRMIGVTVEGFVKVWMNDNFAVNHPAIERMSPFTTTDYLPTDNQTLRSEVQMVKDLLKVIEYHTENGQFPNEWQIEKLSRTHLTFLEANRLIQSYVRKHGMFVPDRLSQGKILRITKVPIAKPSVITETLTITEKPSPVMVQTHIVENIKPQSTQSTTFVNSIMHNGRSLVTSQPMVSNRPPSSIPMVRNRPPSFPLVQNPSIIQSQLQTAIVGPSTLNPMKKTRVLINPAQQNSSIGTLPMVLTTSPPPSIIQLQTPARNSSQLTQVQVHTSTPSHLNHPQTENPSMPTVIIQEEENITFSGVQQVSRDRIVGVRQVQSIPWNAPVAGASVFVPSHVTDKSSESSIQAFIPGPPLAINNSNSNISSPGSKIVTPSKFSELGPNKQAYINRDSTPMVIGQIDKPPSLLISGISSEAPSRIQMNYAI